MNDENSRLKSSSRPKAFTKSGKLVAFFMSFLLCGCGLGCLTAWQWFVVGCLWMDCAIHQPFNSREIQVPAGYFPKDVVYNNLHPNSEIEGAQQRESQTIFWGETNGNTAVFTIARYGGQLKASSEFRAERNSFRDTSGTLWTRPDEVTFQSLTADQSFIGCGVLGGPRCAYVARYDEYLLTLSITIDKQMTLQHFERILEYLDTTVANRLTQ